MPISTRSGKKSVQSAKDQEDETAARLKTVHEQDEDDDDVPTTPLATQPADVDEADMMMEDNDQGEDDDDDEEEKQKEKTPKAKGNPAAAASPSFANEQPAVVVDEEATVLLDKYIFDMMDYQQEIIIADRESRAKVFAVHQRFWENHYYYSDKQFGRLYARWLMLRILVDACCAPAYEPVSGLVNWNAEAWRELIEQIEVARDACTRRDCTIVKMSPSTKPIPEKGEHSTHKSFHLNFMNCLGLSRIQEVLAPIRMRLEKQIKKGKKGKPKIDAETVEQVFKDSQAQENAKVRYWLLKLFEPAEDGAESEGETEVARRPVLKVLADLEGILGNKPFDLNFVQDKLDSMIQTWNILCFGGTDATLFKLKYNPPRGMRDNQSPRMKARAVAQGTPIRSPSYHRPELSSLKRGRDALRDGHGEDPLERSREIAEEATGVPRAQPSAKEKKKKKKKQKEQRVESGDEDEAEDSPSPKKPRGSHLYEEKKSAAKITFDDSDEEESDSDEETDDDDQKKPAKLSKLPKKRRSILAAIRHPNYHPPDEGRFDAAGHVLTRVPFDAEEDNAIRAGLKRFGMGHWQQIKNHNPYILRNRTNIMIKDRYRNMLRLGLVDPPALEEEDDDDDGDDENNE